MPLKVNKRPYETDQGLIRRFKGLVRSSGVLTMFVERSRFKKPSTKRQETLKALKRKGYKK